MLDVDSEHRACYEAMDFLYGHGRENAKTCGCAVAKESLRFHNLPKSRIFLFLL